MVRPLRIPGSLHRLSVLQNINPPRICFADHSSRIIHPSPSRSPFGFTPAREEALVKRARYSLVNASIMMRMWSHFKLFTRTYHPKSRLLSCLSLRHRRMLFEAQDAAFQLRVLSHREPTPPLQTNCAFQNRLQGRYESPVVH